MDDLTIYEHPHITQIIIYWEIQSATQQFGGYRNTLQIIYNKMSILCSDLFLMHHNHHVDFDRNRYCFFRIGLL
jgi:hypothetical protein